MWPAEQFLSELQKTGGSLFSKAWTACARCGKSLNACNTFCQLLPANTPFNYARSGHGERSLHLLCGERLLVTFVLSRAQPGTGQFDMSAVNKALTMFFFVEQEKVLTFLVEK